MERLTSIQTIKESNGKTHKQFYCFGHLWGPAFFKRGTKDYEEYLTIVKRLAEYEDLEEQGKLLKLHCKMGDMVWNNDFGRPCCYTVVGFSFGKIDDKEENDIGELQVYCQNSSGSIRIRFPISEIGKTIFRTQEEAEAALKILNESKIEGMDAVKKQEKKKGE